MRNWKEKLELLTNLEGFEDTMDLLEENSVDSVVPGICVNEDCDYSCEIEPDSNSGWCEECNTNSVHSCLILAGII